MASPSRIESRPRPIAWSLLPRPSQLRQPQQLAHLGVDHLAVARHQRLARDFVVRVEAELAPPCTRCASNVVTFLANIWLA